jgi:hypothetical protein
MGSSLLLAYRGRSLGHILAAGTAKPVRLGAPVPWPVAMWIPKSAAEVEDAAARADLEETHTFDAKKGLPPAKKNHDIAVDVDAMTVNGGSIVYGLGEDNNKRLTVLAPFELAGVPERIAQIVETGITEPPFIRIQTLPLENDPSKGYVLVIVPQSPRAPHQVIADGDMRYYGRGAKATESCRRRRSVRCTRGGSAGRSAARSCSGTNSRGRRSRSPSSVTSSRSRAPSRPTTRWSSA